METRPKALVTGGSRGVGAATAVALAEYGFDIALLYREKKSRADKVAEAIRKLGQNAIALGGDITDKSDRQRLFKELDSWTPVLNALVLNASGGLERERLQAEPDYPKRINHDAQLAVMKASLSLLESDSTVVFVTSNWAHLYGQVEQLPDYEPVACSKYLGETALRGQQAALAERDIRLLVVTGDLVDGTITAKLLERQHPGLADMRKSTTGHLVSTEDMAGAIAGAIVDANLPSGHTVVVGPPLSSLLT